MGPKLTKFEHNRDFERVSRFLVETYRTAGTHLNWLQPRWEYMHYHPLIRDVNVSQIGLWEDDGHIVGVIHPEHEEGTVYLQIRDDNPALKKQMLQYAEQHLSIIAGGLRRLRVLINRADQSFQGIATAAGYDKTELCESMSEWVLPSSVCPPPLPEGFHLKSLAEDNDLYRVEDALWRGFEHQGEPPVGWLEDRQFAQSAPNYRKDLNIVVEAPSGCFVSYCGMWLEPTYAVAYVEPVATVPEFRRRGLARTAVLEGVRRCVASGAERAYVGGTLPLYESLGFRTIFYTDVWQRSW
ncbi:MAG: GNAT family N-acetyltransferase [Planctomycetota bacterium]